MIKYWLCNGFTLHETKYDSIYVIMERLTMSTHSLPMRMTDIVTYYAKLYLKESVRLHNIPMFIISNKGTQFIAHFWKYFQEGLGTHANLRTTFHQQKDGQTERII